MKDMRKHIRELENYLSFNTCKDLIYKLPTLIHFKKATLGESVNRKDEKSSQN